MGSSLLQPITGPWSVRCTITAAPWPGCRRSASIVRLAVERERRQLDRDWAADGARQFRRRAPGRAALRVGQQAFDRPALAASVVAAALDHHLGRVDVALLQDPGVGALALGGAARGEGILPANVVP